MCWGRVKHPNERQAAGNCGLKCSCVEAEPEGFHYSCVWETHKHQGPFFLAALPIRFDNSEPAVTQHILFIWFYSLAPKTYLKVHFVVFGRIVVIDSIVCLNKQTLCFHDWINKLTLQDNIISFCFYFVYMWQTPPPFLDSNSALVTLFSPENSSFLQRWKR